VTRATFRSLVEEAIDAIPPRFARQVRNVAIMIEDEPSEELRRDMEMGPDDQLLGLYTGTPLPEREWNHGNVLPDQVILFQKAIEEEAGDDSDEIVVAIGETLIHELGHYFGMGEDEIMAIEEQFWRGEAFDADDEEPGDEES